MTPLKEKGGKAHKMPCHHNLELIAYIDGAALRAEPKAPLFPTMRGARAAAGSLPARSCTRRTPTT
jgi:hypothetical protein